jgi:pyruvate,water dikinase
MSLDQFSFHEDFPRLKEYDPQISIKALYQKWSLLPEKTRDAVKSHKDLQLKLKGLDDFKNDFDILLHRFGHFSESGNDFSYPPWRENPDFLLTAIKNESDTEQLKGHRSEKTSRLLKSKTYRRAGKFRLYREMISSAYTKGYGLFRVLFKYTGEHLAETGKIRHPDDVFYLTLEQHDALLRSNNKEQIKALTKKIKQVQKEISASENITLPSVIYGELPPPIIEHDHKALRGIPVSSGMFTGEIVVVKGYQDFEKVIDGKILIIPFSDVGWTTILSQAGAIVSESGGILSHASIIAREFSIPAISSVDHACQLKDGLNATVDANNGSLIIEESYVE